MPLTLDRFDLTNKWACPLYLSDNKMFWKVCNMVLPIKNFNRKCFHAKFHRVWGATLLGGLSTLSIYKSLLLYFIVSCFLLTSLNWLECKFFWLLLKDSDTCTFPLLLHRRKKKCMRASEGDEEDECESKCEGTANSANTSSEGVKANSSHHSDSLAVGASLSATVSSKTSPVEESIPSSLTIKQEASTWLDSFTTFSWDCSTTSSSPVLPASLSLLSLLLLKWSLSFWHQCSSFTSQLTPRLACPL